MKRRFLALAALVTFAGCSLDKQGVPQLAGPSELGLSLAIKVSPDIITQDGASRAGTPSRAAPGIQPERGCPTTSTAPDDHVLNPSLSDCATSAP